MTALAQMNPEEFDLPVSEFIEYLWVSGEPKSWANDTCSGLQHHVPNLRGKLVGSWRLLKAWSKTELPNRATPMSLVVLQAFMGMALKEHDLNHALCYALCFQGLLRPAGAFQLIPQAVDLDLQACSAILTLNFSKVATRTGSIEQISVDDPLAVFLLTKWISNDHRDSSANFIQNVSQFRRRFNARNLRLGFPKRKYKPYSMRRGGATLLLKLTQSYDHVTQRGRWAHVRTARIYINEAQAELANHDMSPAQSQLTATCATPIPI